MKCLIIILLFATSVSAQTASQRVHIITVDPPTVCVPGHFYNNSVASKSWMGSSTSTCVQIAGSGGGPATLGANTFTGRQIISVNGASAAPPLSLTGTIFTGGGTTNTKPQFLIEPTGATSTAWNNNGTMLGVNAPSGFVGFLFDGQLNGASNFSVTRTGVINVAADVQAQGFVRGSSYQTLTNCADSAGAAACGAAAAGAVVIDAAATSVVVSTTAVSANSEIFIQNDSSLGTRLSVTCNTQSSLVLGTPRVTARTAGTSFTVTIEAGPTTNPLCLNFKLVN